MTFNLTRLRDDHRAIVEPLLERSTYPLERIATLIAEEAKWGTELSLITDTQGRVPANAHAVASGAEIYFHPKPELLASTLFHEIGHIQDRLELTQEQREVIYYGLHNYIPGDYGPVWEPGKASDEEWNHKESEAYATLFACAFSPDVTIYGSAGKHTQGMRITPNFCRHLRVMLGVVEPAPWLKDITLTIMTENASRGLALDPAGKVITDPWLLEKLKGEFKRGATVTVKKI